MFDQKKWERLVDKSFEDYNSLTKEERICLSIFTVMGSVDNGGTASLYYNTYADNIYDIMEDFETIGYNEYIEAIKEINNLYPNGIVPLDIDVRNEIMEEWFEDEDFSSYLDELYDKADDIFYDKERELEKLGIELMAKLII